MTSIRQLRRDDDGVVILGSHPGIIQSILDYDFLIGRKQPSVLAIVAGGRKSEKYFWGESEITIPVVSDLEFLGESVRTGATAIINVLSARRVLASTKAALELLPRVKLVNIFAEQTPEAHSIELIGVAEKKQVLIVGPSSVGMLIPGHLKVGAIGGTQHQQISGAHILKGGDTAVISTSGGMVNELILMVTSSGLGVSFAVALGGDRYPITTPAQAMLLAQQDPQTKQIVYFGELGGIDEYEIAQLMRDGKLTKKVIAYVAGTVAELFENPPQFGHAKALAKTQDETSSAKKRALQESGAVICDTFADMEKALGASSGSKVDHITQTIGARSHRLITSHISGDRGGDVQLLGGELLDVVNSNSVASLTLSMLLGKQVDSKKASDFVDLALRLLVDHGPYVSGALNTIVAARAGKDLVSSLSAGLLTIGPRFGGAINEAARHWLEASKANMDASDFVESFVAAGGVIPGIGHKKYTADLPDPRVQALKQFAHNTNDDRYLRFALAVEEVTLSKKRSLILNVDGVIAAILLDLLESELGYDQKSLGELVSIEFFNALFVLSRSVGLAAHYLDQRRNDEGLLRLSEGDVRYLG